MEDINHIIQQVASGKELIQTYAAKVISINKTTDSPHNPDEAYTVDVVRSDGARINNVRLKASIQDKEQGFVCVPKKNSWVFISIIETTETRAFISQYSEIDKIFLRIRKGDLETGSVNNTPKEFFEVHADADAVNLIFKKEETANSYTETLKTSITNSEIKIDFDQGKGYQAVLDKDKVELRKESGPYFKMEEKFLIEKGEANLKTELDNFITEVSRIVVAQGTGPNLGALAAIKNKIDEIMK